MRLFLMVCILFFLFIYFNDKFNQLGVIGAEKGTLTFMVGTESNHFKLIESILLKMGKNIVHVGSNGSGIAAKICNNLLVAIR